MTESHDIFLHSSRGGDPLGLTLQNGGDSISQSFVGEDEGVVIRAVSKKIGDFDEQNTWKGGMGGERFSQDPSKFFDAKDCWTLSPNHVIPTIQWKFAKGLRDEDFSLAGSKEWKPMLGADKYVSVSFVASASYTVEHAFAWIRSRGAPNDLTIAIYSDTAGEPNAAVGTPTTVSSLDDILSVLQDFTYDQAITSGTTYHAVIYAGADTDANHWEVACDAGTAGNTSTDGSTWASSTYSPYYRFTDVDVDRKFWFFFFQGSQYAVDKKADLTTASQLYINGARGVASDGASTLLTDTGIGWVVDRWIGAYVRIIAGTGKGQIRLIKDSTADTLVIAAWDKIVDATSEYVIYGTPWWSEIGSTGLGVVLSKPVSANGVAYFPQGSGDNIREMQISSGAEAFDDNGTAKADTLLISQDVADGPQVWKSLAQNIARADVTAWATDLVFRTAIPVGDSDYDVTNMVAHNGIIVFKPDSVWVVSNDKATDLDYGLRDVPDSRNGQAATSFGKFMYFNWMSSIERDYSGTLDDIGLGWSGPALPDGREGYVSSFENYIAWLFYAIDAGDGTSSVVAWDGFGHHEIARAPEAGARINSVTMQPCEGTRNRLWYDCGGDILYQVWPKWKANPLYDSSVDFMHEAVMESSAIDMGTASRLRKYISRLTAYTKNLKTGITVGASYQEDDNVGTNRWKDLGAFNKSPEDLIDVKAENIGRFSYRLILNTNDQNVPPDITGVAPSGFARTPFKKVWNIRIKTGKGFTKRGTRDLTHDEIIRWLYSAACFPGSIAMRTVSYSVLDGEIVSIVPPQVNCVSPADIGKQEKAVITLKLIQA